MIGLTGPPGVGKSTLASALIRHWRDQELTVAVLAIDPSSPKTGGAWLGDRIRMLSHTSDPGVFIRSVANRGQLGGLAATTAQMVELLRRFGWDRILVETVGVGQNEVDIVGVASPVVLVLSPAMGDSIQAEKSGVLEVADIVVVNQADRPDADRTLEVLFEVLSSKTDSFPILSTVATTGVGVADLVAAIDDHR